MKTKKLLTNIELARIYTKVGMNAFGGWSTTYVLLEKELTKHRVLLTKQQLETAIASGQALPGPAQVIIAAQTSYFLNGYSGAFLGTFCYLLPSIVLTLWFCFVYFAYLSQSEISRYMLGIQAAVAGIILGNAVKIAQQTAPTVKLWLMVLLAGALYYLTKIPPMLIIVAFGTIGVGAGIYQQRKNRA